MLHIKMFGLAIMVALVLTVAAGLAFGGTAAAFAVDRCECSDTVNGNGNGKVTIFHIPPGNPDNAHFITVATQAVAAHEAHGDEIVRCDGPD